MNNKTRFSLQGILILGVVLISILFLINSVQAAETTIGLKKSGDCIELIQTCSNCTFNNISSVILPDGTSNTTILIMTKSDTYYNYTYCNTIDVGKYIVNGWGDLDGKDTVWSYTFDVTHNGKSDTFNSWFIITMTGFTIMLLMYGVSTSNPFAGFISGMLFLFIGVYLMIYGYASITDIYSRGVAFASIGFGAMISFAAGYNYIDKGGDD